MWVWWQTNVWFHTVSKKNLRNFLTILSLWEYLGLLACLISPWNVLWSFFHNQWGISLSLITIIFGSPFCLKLVNLTMNLVTTMFIPSHFSSSCLIRFLLVVMFLISKILVVLSLIFNSSHCCMFLLFRELINLTAFSSLSTNSSCVFWIYAWSDNITLSAQKLLE